MNQSNHRLCEPWLFSSSNPIYHNPYPLRSSPTSPHPFQHARAMRANPTEISSSCLIGEIELIGFSPQVSQLQYEVGLKSDLIRVLNQQMNSESNEDLTTITNASYSHFHPVDAKWSPKVKGTRRSRGGNRCLVLFLSDKGCWLKSGSKCLTLNVPETINHGVAYVVCLNPSFIILEISLPNSNKRMTPFITTSFINLDVIYSTIRKRCSFFSFTQA